MGIGKFLCKYLKWHKPKKMQVLGVNIHSECEYCGKQILRDSQGNWF